MENSLGNVFRFVQKRPVGQIGDDGVIVLRGETLFAAEISKASLVDRRRLADRRLKQINNKGWTDETIDDEMDTVALVQSARESGMTIQQFRTELGKLASFGNAGKLETRTKKLSDALVAIRFGSAGASVNLEREHLADLYRAYQFYLSPPDADAKSYVSPILRRALMTPAAFSLTTPAKKPKTKTADALVSGEHIESAINELVALNRAENWEISGLSSEGTGRVEIEDDGRKGEKPSIATARLKATSIESLSKSTVETLKALSLDISDAGIVKTVAALEEQQTVLGVRARLRHLKRKKSSLDIDDLLAVSGNPYVTSAGIADLLVVKQNIKKYERTEIAHVENVMSGETRSRTHRFFSRREETLFEESERTTEEEHELETANRFEMNKETEQTIKTDRKIGFELSLSGKYGPTVEFSSSLSMETSTLNEQSSRSASRFAQDVVERSLSRVIDRVKESRTLTLVRETEETNLHSFTNTQTPAEHIVGVYQFLDKIYEAQVFNYGIRQMFDFMVPEPASFLWYVEGEPGESVSLPKPPEALENYVVGWSDVTPGNYKALEVAYGAEEIPTPPPRYRTYTASLTEGDGSASESDQPRSMKHLDIDVPAGYWPVSASAKAQVFTDEYPQLFVQIGQGQRLIDFTSAYRYNLGNGKRVGRRGTLFLLDIASDAFHEDEQLGIDVLAWETANYSIEFEITCQRSERHYQNWQKQAYRMIYEAYQDRVREHQLELQEIEANARAEAEERDFGQAPSVHLKMIMQELKKHCISIITQQWYDAFDSVNDEEPPTFDLAQAASEGEFIRFFEHAFEWDQLQYVFYPYYWARKETWIPRFLKSDVDPVFQEFLQSGAARVVVPVRPGFELAVNHYLETGQIWNGDGEPPMIGSSTYVAIVDEIRERTGASKGEFPVGEHWDVRMPTPLVILRDRKELPTWTRTSDQTWDWSPVDSGNGDSG